MRGAAHIGIAMPTSRQRWNFQFVPLVDGIISKVKLIGPKASSNRPGVAVEVRREKKIVSPNRRVQVSPVRSGSIRTLTV